VTGSSYGAPLSFFCIFSTTR